VTVPGWKDEEIRRLAFVARREGFNHRNGKVREDLLAINELLLAVVAK
jgi:hypothetical protein